MAKPAAIACHLDDTPNFGYNYRMAPVALTRLEYEAAGAVSPAGGSGASHCLA